MVSQPDSPGQAPRVRTFVTPVTIAGKTYSQPGEHDACEEAMAPELLEHYKKLGHLKGAWIAKGKGPRNRRINSGVPIAGRDYHQPEDMDDLEKILPPDRVEYLKEQGALEGDWAGQGTWEEFEKL